MDQDKLDDILSKRSSMLDDLSSAYEQAGLQITVNRETGEVMLDSAVLFGVDETQISDEGKEFLKQFMQIYTDVVFSEPYSGFVSKILIQGHTDTNGSYEMNQALSQARADSVRDYCLSSECAVEAHMEQLQTMLLAQGYSYDNPILDAEGNVDMDASRRVSFLFLIDLE
jgi:chemotaxis protein MotB